MATATSGLVVSFDSSPQLQRLQNTTIALVAITLARAADGQVQTISSVEVAQKLRTGRRLANIVVVSIHWGAELVDWPSRYSTDRLSGWSIMAPTLSLSTTSCYAGSRV